MGMKSLSEELGTILRESRGAATGTGCRGCGGNLAEALRILAEDSGMEPAALMESMKCNNDCRQKYLDKDGSFKGGSGESFDSCVEMFEKCCSGVKDPAKLCAYIGKRAGRI